MTKDKTKQEDRDQDVQQEEVVENEQVLNETNVDYKDNWLRAQADYQNLQKEMLKVFSTSQTGKTLTKNLNTLLCCLPKISAPNLSYENIFRVIVLKFMDAYDFDVRSVKKSCVHIVHKDGRMIPFETMNLFYRDEKEDYLNQLIQKENSTLNLGEYV